MSRPSPRLRGASSAPTINDPPTFARLLSEIPLGRVGQPSEVAHLAAYLVSDAAPTSPARLTSLDGGMLRQSGSLSYHQASRCLIVPGASTPRSDRPGTAQRRPGPPRLAPCGRTAAPGPRGGCAPADRQTAQRCMPDGPSRVGSASADAGAPDRRTPTGRSQARRRRGRSAEVRARIVQDRRCACR